MKNDEKKNLVLKGLINIRVRIIESNKYMHENMILYIFQSFYKSKFQFHKKSNYPKKSNYQEHHPCGLINSVNADNHCWLEP